MRSIFKCNNYPVNIIDQCIKKFLDKLYIPKHIVPAVSKMELLIVFPFSGKFSMNLRIRLFLSAMALTQGNIKAFLSVKID